MTPKINLGSWGFWEWLGFGMWTLGFVTYLPIASLLARL